MSDHPSLSPEPPKLRYHLIIEAGKDPLNRPPEIRLRLALRILLRRLALKCRFIEPLKPGQPEESVRAE